MPCSRVYILYVFYINAWVLCFIDIAIRKLTCLFISFLCFYRVIPKALLPHEVLFHSTSMYCAFFIFFMQYWNWSTPTCRYQERPLEKWKQLQICIKGRQKWENMLMHSLHFPVKISSWNTFTLFFQHVLMYLLNEILNIFRWLWNLGRIARGDNMVSTWNPWQTSEMSLFEILLSKMF